MSHCPNSKGWRGWFPTSPLRIIRLARFLKYRGDPPGAVKEFETARHLNPRLAAPHFQLYGLYRQLSGRRMRRRNFESFRN